MTVRGQLSRFLLVGSLTVLLDLAVYVALLRLNINVDIAKGGSFIAGTVFAYLANRHWTFAARGGWQRFVKFIVLYLSTLIVNVGINQAVLMYMKGWMPEFAVGSAFLLATAISATMNFIGMRFFVFQTNQVRMS